MLFSYILLGKNCRDVRVGSLIPVQETFKIDHVADVEVLDCLVDVGVRSAEIGLNSEAVSLSVYGDVEVKVIAFRSGTVPIVQVSSCAVLADGLNCHAFEDNFLVLLVNQLVCTEKSSDVFGFRNVFAVFELPDRVDNFNFA